MSTLLDNALEKVSALRPLFLRSLPRSRTKRSRKGNSQKSETSFGEWPKRHSTRMNEARRWRANADGGLQPAQGFSVAS